MVTALNDNLLDAWVEDDNLQSGGDPDCQPLYRPLCLKPVVVACTHAKLKQHEDCPSQVCWSLNDIIDFCYCFWNYDSRPQYSCVNVFAQDFEHFSSYLCEHIQERQWAVLGMQSILVFFTGSAAHIK